MQKILLILFILFLIMGCSEKPQEKLIGSWVVDYNETFKMIKSSEAWQEMGDVERNMFPDLLDEMISGMKITITASELITMIGNEQVNVPYTIISEETNKVVVSTVINEEEIELTFKIINDNRIMFTSSVTDDMDYLVWKKEVVQKV
jgi:hypothetical protein